MDKQVFTKILFIFTVSLLFSACTTMRFESDIRSNIASKNYDKAIDDIQKNFRKNEKDIVIKSMFLGSLHRINGDFKASNAALEIAKNSSEYLRRLSITENALSTVYNDSALSYTGERFEIFMIYIYKMLNFVALGDWYGARVEIRQANLYAQSLKKESLDFAAYRYLSGNIYEALGEYDSALIDYRKAVELYGVQVELLKKSPPKYLLNDYLRMLNALGRDNEISRVKSKYKINFKISPVNQKYALVIQNLGFAPIKRTNTIHVGTSSGIISVSLPSYQRNNTLRKAENIRYLGKGIFANEQLANIDEIARITLQRNLPAITARNVARIIAKNQINQLAIRNAKDSDNDASTLLAIGSIITNAITESADTRGWSILPAQIVISKIPLSKNQNIKNAPTLRNLSILELYYQ